MSRVSKKYFFSGINSTVARMGACNIRFNLRNNASYKSLQRKPLLITTEEKQHEIMHHTNINII